jgi:Putative zinc-finger
MNCKHVQELLPLYVGRDLEATRAQLITAHMQSCADCAGSADEYRQTRQLLQQFAPPLFNEAVYTGIRQRVLREIESEATTPTLTESMAGLFRPRLRWAVATALLVIVSVFAFYFVANRMKGREQVAGGHRTINGLTSPSIKEVAGPPPVSVVENGGGTKRLTGGSHLLVRRKSPAAADRTRPATVKSTDTRSIIVEASRKVNDIDEPNAASDRDAATSEKPLRVEMQTKDPNIRIIWFAHQPTKQDSSSRFSKGT